MNVAHIVSNLDDRFGGPSKSVPALVANLERYGVYGDIIYNRTISDERNEVVDMYGLNAVGINTYFKHSMYYSPELPALLCSKEKYDLIHIHSMWRYNAYAAYRSACRVGIPYVVSPRSNLYSESMDRSSIKKKAVMKVFVRDMLNRASFIHATDVSEKRAVELLGIGAPAVVIPNGITFETLGNHVDNERDRVVLYMSRLHPRKGIEELLEAWKKLFHLHGQWRLIIAGHCASPSYESYLRNLADGDPSISFVGHTTGCEKSKLLWSSSIFVLPSYFENFGIAVGEAMYARNAIVTTSATPWASYGDRIGRIIPPYDVAALAKAIDSLASLHDTGGMDDIRDNARNIAARFQWGEIAKAMAEHYQDAIANSGKLMMRV